MKEDARTALRLFEQVAANGSFVREADVDQILLNDRSVDKAAIRHAAGVDRRFQKTCLAEEAHTPSNRRSQIGPILARGLPGFSNHSFILLKVR